MRSKTERKFDENANLKKYTNLNAPPADSNSEYVIGDLHANAFLMLYFFQREGISQFSDEDLQTQYDIYHWKIEKTFFTLLKEQLNLYQNILKKTSFNPVKKIHFIGDTLADRGMGDHYVLYNYQALTAKNIDFDVTLSNHDLEFILAYWKAENRGDLCEISASTIRDLHGTQIASTLSTVKVSRARDNPQCITFSEIKTLVETYYLPHVNLISYTLTEEGIVLMTHAPVDFELIRCAAEALEVNYKDDTAAALAKTIDAINAAFREKYIQTADIVDLNEHSDAEMKALASNQGGIRAEKIDGLITEKRMAYIVEALTWNRPHGNLNRPETHHGYNLHYVHGHTLTTNDPDHVINLDSVFGKQIDKYEPDGQIFDKPKCGVGYRVLRCEALQVEPKKIQSSSVMDDNLGAPKSLDKQGENFSAGTAESLNAYLGDIKSICEKLYVRYEEKKLYDKSNIYAEKSYVIMCILNIINSHSNAKTTNEKISEVAKLYEDNTGILEKEHDPTNKNLLKALKVILVGLGLVAGVVPGLIALGIFAKSASDRTGSANFLSDEANKTSQAIELKSALNKVTKKFEK